MAFCTQCGHEVADGTRFCTNCGAPIVPRQNSAAPAQAYMPHAQGETGSQVSDGYAPQVTPATQPAPTPATQSVPVTEPTPTTQPVPTPAAGPTADSLSRGKGKLVAAIVATVAVVAVGVVVALVASGIVRWPGAKEAPAAATTASAAATSVAASASTAQTSAPASTEAASPTEAPAATSAAETSSGTAAASEAPASSDPYGETVALAQGTETGPELGMTLDTAPRPELNAAFATVEPSSTLDPEPTNKYYVSNLSDGDLSTAWVEGQSGSGAGAYLVFSNAPEGTTVKSLLIAPGYQKSKDIYGKNARPKQVTIIADGKVVGSATLSDVNGQWQAVSLPQEIAPKVLALRIDSVYPGSRDADCCISELRWERG